jgi:hypothetical protein
MLTALVVAAFSLAASASVYSHVTGKAEVSQLRDQLGTTRHKLGKELEQSKAEAQQLRDQLGTTRDKLGKELEQSKAEAQQLGTERDKLGKEFPYKHSLVVIQPSSTGSQEQEAAATAKPAATQPAVTIVSAAVSADKEAAASPDEDRVFNADAEITENRVQYRLPHQPLQCVGDAAEHGSLPTLADVESALDALQSQQQQVVFMVGDSTMRHQFVGWCQLLEGKKPKLNQETPKDGYSVYVCTGQNIVVAYLADGKGGWQGGWQSRYAYWKINSKTGLNATAMYFNGGRLALAPSAALIAASTASFRDSANSAVILAAYCALKVMYAMGA